MRTRKEIAELINGLAYDFGHFTVADFIEHLGQAIDRRILSLRCAMPAGVFGAWLTDSEHPLEYLIVDQTISGQHAIHIQLHELGHIALNHQTGSITTHLLETLISGRDDSPLKQALHRRASRQDDEQEAELFAVIVQERLIAAARINYLEASSSTDTLQQYFDDLGV